MWPIVPEIAHADTLRDILGAMMPLLIVAIGQTFVLIVAGIDLSATSIIAMASVVGASVMTGDGGYRRRATWLGDRRRHPGLPRRRRRASARFNGALHHALQHAVLHRHADDDDVLLRRGDLVSRAAHDRCAARSATCRRASSPSARAGSRGVPFSLPIALVVARRRPSRPQPHRLRPLALRDRPQPAGRRGLRRAGAPRRVLGLRHLAASAPASPSILYTGRLETGTPVLGQRILLDVIGAAVIGGVSLFGGKGKVIWTVFGVLFLTVDRQGPAAARPVARLGLRDQGRRHPRSPRSSTRCATACWCAADGRCRRAERRCLHASSRGLCKSFFGVQVLHDVGFALGAGPGARPGRRERLGQVDDDEHPRRRPPDGLRAA